jgi:ligand-binding SRPBCC domain-containing protein
VGLDRGRGFVERSRMLSQRAWEHARTIEAVAGGSVITDSVAWEPRLPLPAGALRPLFRTIFRHRHRRLRRRFGGSARQ